MSLDPVTFQVMRNRLDSIAEEMQSSLTRSSTSLHVKEGGDASSAIVAEWGETAAQAVANPVHLGCIASIAEHIFKVFPPSSLAEGDVLIMNDPFGGGTHLPDVVVAVPIVVGDQAIAFACTMAHWQDIGGMTPGSMPADSTSIFQEGLRIPALKLHDKGVPNETFLKLVAANVRVPDVVLGDINGQVAAGQLGRRRVLAMAEQYGVDALVEAMHESMNRSEVMTRQKLAQIPDGTYRFRDYLDNDGIDLDRRIAIEAAVTVRGSDLHVDFTGTSEQCKGPYNGPPAVAIAAVNYVVRAITDSTIPSNGGCYRPVTLVLPPGTVVNPNFPAPVGQRGVTIRRVSDVVFGALAQAVPDLVTAASNGHPLSLRMGGVDPRNGRTYVTSELSSGGMGARANADGLDVIQTDSSNSRSIPREAQELESPFRALRFALRPDSGGAGRWRGGVGLEVVYELTAGEATVTHRSERMFTSPWGLFGGLPGAKTVAYVMRKDGERIDIPSKLTYRLKAGDRIYAFTAGGGGRGDPFDREPWRVLEDWQDRKVSVAHAAECYGVVIDANANAVNEQETELLRTNLQAARGPITWRYDRGDLGKES